MRRNRDYVPATKFEACVFGSFVIGIIFASVMMCAILAYEMLGGDTHGWSATILAGENRGRSGEIYSHGPFCLWVTIKDAPKRAEVRQRIDEYHRSLGLPDGQEDHATWSMERADVHITAWRWNVLFFRGADY